MHPAAFLQRPPPSSSSSSPISPAASSQTPSPLSPSPSTTNAKAPRPQSSPKSPSKPSGGGFASRLRALTGSSSHLPPQPSSSSLFSSSSPSSTSITSPSASASVSSTETRRGPAHRNAALVSIVPYGPSHVPAVPRPSLSHGRGASTSSAGTALPTVGTGRVRAGSVAAAHPSSYSQHPSLQHPSSNTTTSQTPETHAPADRLAHWISEQCTLVVQDHGFSPTYGGEEVWSASTYVPVGMRNKEALPRLDTGGVGPSSGGAGPSEPGGRGVDASQGGEPRTDEWYWRPSPSPTQSPAPDTHACSASAPRASPDSVTSSEEHLGVIAEAFMQSRGYHSSGVHGVLEEVEEERYEEYRDGYVNGGEGEGRRDGGEGDDARSDSPLLGFGDTPPASPTLATHVDAQATTEASGGGLPLTNENEHRVEGRDANEVRGELYPREPHEEGEDAQKTHHRRSKSSEDTYDFPRTPGPEDLFGLGVESGFCGEAGEDTHLKPPYSEDTLSSPSSPLSPPSPSTASHLPREKTKPLRRKRDPLIFPGRGYRRELPSGFEEGGASRGVGIGIGRRPTTTIQSTVVIVHAPTPRGSGSTASTARDDLATPVPARVGLPLASSSPPSLVSPAPVSSGFASTSASSPRMSPSLPSATVNAMGARTTTRVGRSRSGSVSSPPSSSLAMDSQHNAGGGAGEKPLGRHPSMKRKPSFASISLLGEVREAEEGVIERESRVESEDVMESRAQGEEREEEEGEAIQEGEKEGGNRERSATSSSTASYATARTLTEDTALLPAAEIITPARPHPASRTRSQSASVVSHLRATGSGGSGSTHVPGVQAAFHPHHVQGHGHSQSVSVASSRRGSGETMLCHAAGAFGSVTGPVIGGQTHTQTQVAPSQGTPGAPAPTQTQTPPTQAPTQAQGPSRASVGLGLGPGVGVRVVTRSRANSAAVLNSYAPLASPLGGGMSGISGMSTPPQALQPSLHPSMSMSSLTSPPPSASFGYGFSPSHGHGGGAGYANGNGGNGNGFSYGYATGPLTPPGTAGFSSGMMSAGAGGVEGTPARHAVYIVDGEEVSRRLGELLRGGEGVDLEQDREGGEWDEREQNEGAEERGDGEEARDAPEEKERELADPVLPLTDYFAPVRSAGVSKAPSLVPTVPNTPSLSRNASVGLLQIQQQPSVSAKPSFYASPYASSSQIYLGPGGSFSAASVHSRGSSGGSKGSASKEQQSQAQPHLQPQPQPQPQLHQEEREKPKRTSDTLEPNPVLLASRRNSKSPRSSLAPPPHPAHHGQHLSEALTGPPEHTTLIAHHLNAASTSASGAFSPPSSSASSTFDLGSAGATLLPSPPITMTRAELEARLGPPPKRPPPAPPLDFGLSAEEVRALRARGVVGVGGAPRSPGLGGEGSGFKFPRGPVPPPQSVVAQPQQGPGQMSVTVPKPPPQPIPQPIAVSSVPVVPTERGSYFGVYPHRRSESSSVGHGNASARVVEPDQAVDEEIEAIQREMEGMLFERHRRSLSLDGSFSSNGGGDGEEEGAYRHGVYDESYTVDHGDVDGVERLGMERVHVDVEKEVGAEAGVEVETVAKMGVEEGEESPYGASFAEEMGIRMDRTSLLVVRDDEGEGEDTVKGRGRRAVPLHVAAREYRMSRPRPGHGLSVVVPDSDGNHDRRGRGDGGRAEGGHGEGGVGYEVGHALGAVGDEGAANDHQSRWSVASSSILIQDFPSTPVSVPQASPFSGSTSSPPVHHHSTSPLHHHNQHSTSSHPPTQPQSHPSSQRSSILPAPRQKHLSTASSILGPSIHRASPRSSIQAPKHASSSAPPPSAYTSSAASKHSSTPASTISKHTSTAPSTTSKHTSTISKHAASASTASSASSASASVSMRKAQQVYTDFLDTDDDEEDGGDMDEAVLMSVGMGVVGGMMAMPSAPASSAMFSSSAKANGTQPTTPSASASTQQPLSLPSLPRRSLSKWRKRDRGESNAEGKAKSKSAPSSPTKRASRGRGAVSAAASRELVEGTLGPSVSREKEKEKDHGETTGKEGKRGRLASFFSRISGREGSPASVQSAGSGSHSNNHSHNSTSNSNPNSNSGHSSPLLLLRASSRQSAGVVSASTSSSSNGGMSEPDLRNVSGAWEALGSERRGDYERRDEEREREREHVPPVPPVPPLHTLPRMASRGSLRGVAVLNNSASFSSQNGPYSPVTNGGYSPANGAYSPVPGSPLNGSPRVSYVPGSVQGSPRASYVPSPIIITGPPAPTSFSYASGSPATVASTLNSSSRRTTLVSPPSQPSMYPYEDESIPPTPSSITSFTSSSAASSQVLLLRTSRSVSNLSTVAASPLEDDVFPSSISPSSKLNPSSPPAGRPSFSSAVSRGSTAGSLPPPPVPPKDEGYFPNDGGIPAAHGRKESKGAVAGGVYVPGYEWPTSAPLPPSAFVADSVGPVVLEDGQRRDAQGQGQGVLGRLRLKSSPSLGNLHQKEGERGKGGLRGFAARMVGRT